MEEQITFNKDVLDLMKIISENQSIQSGSISNIAEALQTLLTIINLQGDRIKVLEDGGKGHTHWWNF